MGADPSRVLGLVAGQGELPLRAARSARANGQSVVAIGFPGRTDPALEDYAEVTWLQPGQVGAALGALRDAGVCEAAMLGKVPKAALLARPAELQPDAEALRLLAGLCDRRDDSILGAIADFLEEHGIRLLAQVDLLPDLVGAVGVLGGVEPTAEQRADVSFGFGIAKVLAGVDVGQTVVVKDGAVLAVEAIEGTDAAIRRAGEIAPGACAVKVAKPSQDPRFDVPTIGPDTLAALRDAKAAALAFEAGRTLVLDRDALVVEAGAHGIALFGIRGDPA
ncbi:MAG: UDP-2,3-diacylglucosamine diphosphatase LpxI [Myxococcota bacterium]|nr:hypothetical protein [Deltaproteobacteria bacterium]MDP6073808.1 UDP-2,3-diacylglucosamine diphosphatase LpxI [Myxococcota bacterium]MDP6242238.1 UDP-2,3-diacylglucosamine diphosphatase LpxI [Myxococcota bacterium]MDP7075343.1 UDP-2,3-diacylglucosamine diphosphatase LpxI [Myxococcota bacterium]MDP7298103.1 UDP-2,3-diacylglucosamine diphosphatase LpxI [Myxococcota bacterium]